MPNPDSSERTDRERIDWLSSHPANIKWDHRRGWIVSFGFPFGETEGYTLRIAIDRAIDLCLEKGPPHAP
jgi:hypothetical protein